eukprot:768814-Hanusia_phi.AAC.8
MRTRIEPKERKRQSEAAAADSLTPCRCSLGSAGWSCPRWLNNGHRLLPIWSSPSNSPPPSVSHRSPSDLCSHAETATPPPVGKHFPSQLRQAVFRLPQDLLEVQEFADVREGMSRVDVLEHDRALDDGDGASLQRLRHPVRLYVPSPRTQGEVAHDQHVSVRPRPHPVAVVVPRHRQVRERVSAELSAEGTDRLHHVHP